VDVFPGNYDKLGISVNSFKRLWVYLQASTSSAKKEEGPASTGKLRTNEKYKRICIVESKRSPCKCKKNVLSEQ
jgi:hypothetical protein